MGDIVDLGSLSPAERSRRQSLAAAKATEDEHSAREFLNHEIGLGLGPDALTTTLSPYWPRRLRALSEAAGIMAEAMERSQRILRGEEP